MTGSSSRYMYSPVGPSALIDLAIRVETWRRAVAPGRPGNSPVEDSRLVELATRVERWRGGVAPGRPDDSPAVAPPKRPLPARYKRRDPPGGNAAPDGDATSVRIATPFERTMKLVVRNATPASSTTPVRNATPAREPMPSEEHREAVALNRTEHSRAGNEGLRPKKPLPARYRPRELLRYQVTPARTTTPVLDLFPSAEETYPRQRQLPPPLAVHVSRQRYRPRDIPIISPKPLRHRGDVPGRLASRAAGLTFIPPHVQGHSSRP